MAVIKEYSCLAHGPFEAAEPICPHGCTTAVKRQFFTAPGTRSAKTKASDVALERLARRFGLSDISNRKGSVMESRRGFGKIGGMDFSPVWGTMPKGHNLEVGKGIVERDGAQGGGEALGKTLGTGRIADEPAASTEHALPTAQKLVRPRPVVVGRDSVTQDDFKAAVERAS